MPDPTLVVKLTESIDELLIPALSGLLTREPPLAHDTHQARLSIDNKSLAGFWKCITRQTHLEHVSHDLEVLLAAIPARICLGQKRQTRTRPLWAVLGDFWPGGKICGEELRGWGRGNESVTEGMRRLAQSLAARGKRHD
jgi:hypothetical protein